MQLVLPPSLPPLSLLPSSLPPPTCIPTLSLPCRFVFYETVDMRALRPLEQTRQLHPGVKSLEAWLGEHRAAFEQLFGAE